MTVETNPGLRGIIMDSQQQNSSQLLSAAVGAGLSGSLASPTPPPQPFESYRWYRCEQAFGQTECIQLKSKEDIHILGMNSKLVPVVSWIPEKLDRAVLSYTLWLDHKTILR